MRHISGKPIKRRLLKTISITDSYQTKERIIRTIKPVEKVKKPRGFKSPRAFE